MTPCKIFSFFILLLIFLNFATIEAQDDPFYLYQYCSSNRTTANSSFQLNLKTLLSSLSSNATGDTQFYNTTFTGENPYDSIYGMFMCRGDIPSQLCQQCVVNASQRLSSECSLSKEAVFWYDECMVWYSTTSFFSTVATTPSFSLLNPANVSNPQSFMHLLYFTMNQTANEASDSPIGDKKFATKEANVSRFQTLYCLAQCTPDLSPSECKTCLNGVIEELPSCCEGRIGGRVLYPSCNVRYELYPFYLSTQSSPKLALATKPSHADSKFSDDPLYLSHNCSRNKAFTVNNSTFQMLLPTLLSYLSSNATKSGKNFHKADVADTVFGLYMCRGDLSSQLCAQCIQNATQRITLECSSSQEAIIWYSHCLLRFSYWNFFSKVEKSPIFSELNVTNDSNPNQEEQSFFTYVISNTLSKVAIEAGDSDKRYGTKSLKLNELQTLYTLAQCTQDSSDDDCNSCLGYLMGTSIPWSNLGSVGGRVLYPSCNLRFELDQFYKDVDEAIMPSSPPSSGKGNSKSRTIILIIVVSMVILAILFSIGYYLLKRKIRKSFKTILRENFGHESATLEPLQFDLTTIEAATNNFSDENYVGKGGFGKVYKGILLDGRDIAVKRLSRTSKQGVIEFKNETLLIAKLQHRNLVALIGFCLDEQEKILIYEYVPNKSLDYFLFDSQRQKILSWFERYKIIRGIAQGILYLHEYSRLKVIHRDLKPSNILLDENMTPKISDFGLARIVEINQDRGSTNRIVGTLGYMSPEYAMLGQFSEKSDVFSFGVMILEIITGRKNVNSYELQRIGDTLLSYVWREWTHQSPVSILDPHIERSFSEIEVIKCIQIGLLCVQQHPNVRPTITTIVSYLNNYSIELPTPEEPAFSLQEKMNSTTITQESSSSQSINSSKTLSINEMSLSEFLPR
ncbi:cysteine-rich receptor-like protein kinase 10 [Abrus precatorius]|uniref:Cysteine-rich receptor-like protein kinase 10 n=1 Tax=Abrus precatorius TaxID=3816 RepID=A0A8B8LN03_ABRPR|nr:cysteine-rich receptor-like protein kinase 10 [Abrus precatorius]